MEKYVSFLHSGDMGDIIASLASVKEICEKQQAKARIYLDTSGGMAVNDADLNKIVTMQSKGRGLKFNDAGFSFLAQLIEAQDYVESVEKYVGPHLQRIDYNLNKFRKAFCDIETIKKTNQNLMYLAQTACGLDFGYKGPWLTVPEGDAHYTVIVSRTSRYQSAHVFYAAYEAQLKNGHFIGTDFEYDLYKDAFGYRPNRLKVSNALEAGIAIKNADTFVSNGTLFYWIAVGLGHPEIIHELCMDVPTTFFQNHSPEIQYVQGLRFMK